MPQIPVTTRAAEDRPLVKVVNDSVPNPAAGADFAITVPVGYRFRLNSLAFRFISDANVATRFFTFTITNGSGTPFRFAPAFPCSENETRSACLSSGISPVNWTAVVLSAIWPWPNEVVLEEGDTIACTVTNIQVGDQFSLIAYQLLSQFVAE